MATEFQAFMETISEKSKATQRNYVNSYQKLHGFLGKDIQHSSQDKIIKVIDDNIENPNSQAALVNVAILVRRLFKYDVKELEKRRAKNKETIQIATQTNNTMIKLPSVNELDGFIEDLYVKELWKDYIINYLIRNCYVRNEDLDLEFVDTRRDASDKEKNYIWVTKDTPRVVYIRNNYKTVKVYGQKQNEIRDEQFYNAIKQYRDSYSDTLIDGNLAYQVKRATIDQLGEGAVLKILINEYRADIKELTKISQSRGTSVYTLLTSYNIDF